MAAVSYRNHRVLCTWKSIFPVRELYRHTSMCPDLSSVVPWTYRQTESPHTISQRANPIYAMSLHTDRAKSGRARMSERGVYRVVPRGSPQDRPNLVVDMFERQTTGLCRLIPTRCRSKSPLEQCSALFREFWHHGSAHNIAKMLEPPDPKTTPNPTRVALERLEKMGSMDHFT
jgi:hypothetical protein